jgi:hypothetical protein
MKKLLFLYSLLLITLLSACKSSQEVAQKSVDDKINDFFVAIEKQDFEKAKTLSTPATQKVLEVVMKDAQKYKEFNDKPQTIKVEILDRKLTEKDADYKVRIIIGEKVKEHTIHCVYTNEVWYLDVPQENIAIFRYVVFFDMYNSILVLHKNKYIIRESTVIVGRTHKNKSNKGSGNKKHKWKNK